MCTAQPAKNARDTPGQERARHTRPRTRATHLAKNARDTPGQERARHTWPRTRTTHPAKNARDTPGQEGARHTWPRRRTTHLAKNARDTPGQERARHTRPRTRTTQPAKNVHDTTRALVLYHRRRAYIPPTMADCFVSIPEVILPTSGSSYPPDDAEVITPESVIGTAGTDDETSTDATAAAVVCGIALTAVELPLTAIEPPLTTVKPPLTAVELPPTADEPPLTAVEPPLTAVELPLTAVEPPLITVEPPLITVEPPLTADEPPLTAVEPPLITVEPPLTTVEPPLTAIELPPTADELPLTAVEPPLTAVELPLTAVEPPLTAVEPPLITVEPPLTADEPPLTAVEPPLITVEPPLTADEPPLTAVESPSAAAEPPCSNWTIGSEDNSDDDNEVPTKENVSLKNADTPVLDRKSIHDAISHTPDSTTELDLTPMTKKTRPRLIKTLTEGEATMVKRNSLQLCGWESDDSDVRHRSDSNASSQPLLSRKHASSTERIVAATTAKSKEQENTVTNNENLQSLDNDNGERGDADKESTPALTTSEHKTDGAESTSTAGDTKSTSTAGDTKSTSTAGDTAHTSNVGAIEPEISSTNPVAVNSETDADANGVRPTLKRVSTATLLISEHGVDVVPQIVTSTDDVITSMQVVKQISYRPPMPDNYLVLSCIVMLCCNPLFGLVAFVFSVCTSKSYEEREYQRAKRQSKMALWFALIGVIATLTMVIILLAVYWPRREHQT
ncbi:hypothetical protein LSAT2_029551 [Lamellibrachia satsuma]|nr:hypothetical protein LSAT2_029551 [Lamellibrachia satsuma]